MEKLIARDDIDVIDIAAPNNVHHEIAIAAAKAGKGILCEKPLALNCKEGEEMVREVEKAGVAKYGLVQLPTHSCRYHGQGNDRRRSSWKIITTAPTFCRIGP